MSLTSSDIHKVVHELRYSQGGNVADNVEAFVINTEDLRDLLRQDQFSNQFPLWGTGCDPGQLKICGIKIIDSPYIEKGVVFKMFKNDPLYRNFTDFTLPPEWPIKYIPSSSPTGSDKDEIEKMKLKIKILELETGPVVKEKSKKKYSQTRKIKLG
ncbi:hypothetical protein LCGC14_0141480 [marine sediment metagenome]|uniref:Uncharacterized protein n=1 Tax=marine sediment metagenome TaxID=412755 RepID=A0A0F9V108_9ZZZZ